MPNAFRAVLVFDLGSVPAEGLGGQWNGRAEDVIGIVMALSLDEPLEIAAIAFGHAVRVLVRGQKVRITATKCPWIEGAQCVASPLAMSPLLKYWRPQLSHRAMRGVIVMGAIFPCCRASVASGP